MFREKFVKIILLFLTFLIFSPTKANAQSVLNTDANNDGKVDGSDYVIWLNNYGVKVTGGKAKGDFNADGFVDGQDYVLWLNDYGKNVSLTITPVLSQLPTNSPFLPSKTQTEWSQHAFNAQRTAWAPYELNPWIDKNAGSTNWSFAWKRTDVPTRSIYQVFPVVGDGKVYMATTRNRLYALNLTNGTTVWSVVLGGDLLSTPAYD
ncbi:MAG: PQQ-binding-like beta-propeller repeat protein, partial [Patescibacteria group bacterium]|nr:PQQ-binding-like beta-propeller repeat protein [Patescibacteria group bacterium]